MVPKDLPMSLPLIIDHSSFHPDANDPFPGELRRLHHLKRLSLPYTSWFCLTPWLFHAYLSQTNILDRIRLLLVSGLKTDPDKTASDIGRTIDKTPIPKSLVRNLKLAYKQTVGNEYFVAYNLRSYDGQTLFSDTPHPLKGDMVWFSYLLEVWKHTFNPKNISRFQSIPQRLLTPPYTLVQKYSVPSWSVKIYTKHPHLDSKTKLYLEAVPGINAAHTPIKSNPLTFDIDRKNLNLTLTSSHQLSQKVTVDRFGHYVVKPHQAPTFPPESLLVKSVDTVLKILHFEQHPLMATVHLYPKRLEFVRYTPLFHLPLTGQTHPHTTKPLPVKLTGQGAAPGIVTGPIRILETTKDQAKIEAGDIIVQASVSPQISLYLTKIAGMISETGGITSHAALLAREYGVPSVMSVPQALHHLKNGEIVTLNGQTGEIFAGSLPSTPTSVAPEKFSLHQTATKILLDMSSSRQIPLLTSISHQGIGLIRGEVITGAAKSFSDFTHILHQELSLIIESTLPPVMSYKLYDLPANDRPQIINPQKSQFPEDANPFFGYRGLQWRLHHPELIKAELAVLLPLIKAQTHTRFRLILPFVRFAQEIIAMKKILAGYGLTPGLVDLCPSLDTPAAVLSLKDMAKTGIDGIYLNINHLTALVLGLDPENPAVNQQYDQKHPVMIALCQDVCLKAAEYKLPVYFYGHAVNHSAYLLSQLVRYGAGNLIVSPRSVPFVNHTVYQAEKERVF
jgi:pyruvate, water dikinase